MEDTNMEDRNMETTDNTKKQYKKPQVMVNNIPQYIFEPLLEEAIKECKGLRGLVIDILKERYVR